MLSARPLQLSHPHYGFHSPIRNRQRRSMRRIPLSHPFASHPILPIAPFLAVSTVKSIRRPLRAASSEMTDPRDRTYASNGVRLIYLPQFFFLA